MTIRHTSHAAPHPAPRWTRARASLLSLALALAGTTAGAATREGKWDALYMGEQGLYYIDAKSIRRDGPYTEVWTMLDYKKQQVSADGKAYLSTQSMITLNCGMKMGRIMHMTYFSGAMGSGKEVLKQGMLHDWMEIDPGSPIQRIAKRVC